MNIGAQALRAELGGKEILKGLDIRAENGQFVGIIGPNGSGKSTLLRCICRILRPTGGAVYLDGQPALDWSPRESAQKVGVVAQHNYYSFDFTVREVVLMGRSPHKRFLQRDNAEDYRIVRKAIADVGMADFAERSFSTLSGGEQQRIILARALAQQTPCLILDEPTNHLDMEAITALNNGMIKFPGVILFSSRDHQIVQTTANRIMEIVPGGQLIDKITTYDEYLENDEMARKRQTYSVQTEEND